jgi:hypothetical protein
MHLPLQVSSSSHILVLSEMNPLSHTSFLDAIVVGGNAPG